MNKYTILGIGIGTMIIGAITLISGFAEGAPLLATIFVVPIICGALLIKKELKKNS